MQWYAVHTHPLKEFLAVENLNNQKINTYIPKYQKMIKHARKVSYKDAALFPRYIFAEFDIENTQWFKINHTIGVSRILTDANGIPLKVDNSIIDYLQDKEEDGRIRLDALDLFEKNQKVFITKGKFKGQTALYDKLLDEQRAQLLIQMIQKTVKIAVPLHSIEA